MPGLVKGGAETIIWSLIRCLLNHECYVDLVVLKSSSGIPEVVDDRLKVTLIGSKVDLIKNIRKISQVSYSLTYTSHIVTNGLVNFLRMVGLLRTHRLVTRESSLFRAQAKGFKKIATEILYKLNGAQDLVVAQTPAMKTVLNSDIYKDSRLNVKYISNPIDLDYISARSKEGISTGYLPTNLGPENTLVWCGRMVAIKRPELAIKTLKAINENRAGSYFNLLMIGGGVELPKLKSIVKENGLENQVHFLGELDNPLPYFKIFRYGLLTSAVEGFPNVVLEMLFLGFSKVICTDCNDQLKHIPGVKLSSDHSITSLVEAFSELSASGHHDKEALNRYLTNRSIESFLEQIGSD